MFEVKLLNGLNMDVGIWATFPATIITAILSPINLPIARMILVSIPGLAIGSSTFLIVCHFVAPNASDASLYDCPIASSESQLNVIIVGIIITDKIIEAVIKLNPSPPNIVLISGVITINPKKPYTTEGILVSVCIAGLIILFVSSPEYCVINIEHPSDSGIAIINVVITKIIVLIIIGSMPYVFVSGSHMLPVIKFTIPISCAAGIDSDIINSIIRSIRNTHAMVVINIIFSIYLSSFIITPNLLESTHFLQLSFVLQDLKSIL